MKRLTALLLFVLAGSLSLYALDGISGTWAMLNDKTGKPDAYVLFYTRNATLYGRIIALLDEDTGQIVDTLVSQKERAENLSGKPPLCGLDFIFDMKDKEGRWEGSMFAPGGKGMFLKCRIKGEGTNLIVRASLGPFGQDIIFAPALPENIPQSVIVPDAASLVPNIPAR